MPVEPGRWFDEHELEASRRYHEPVRRVAAWCVGVQLVGLAFVIAVATWVPTLGRLEVIGLTLAVISLPRIAADGWQEFVHERRFVAPPVLATTFVAATSARIVLVACGLVSADLILAGIDRSGSEVGLVALAAGCVPVVAVVLGPRGVLAMHRAEDMSVADPNARRVTELAATFDMPVPRLVRLDASSFGGANAFATGTGSTVTLAVSDELLTGPVQLFDHVVSHELAHISRRHLLWSVVAACLAAGSVVGISTLITVSSFSDRVQLAAFVLIVAVFSVPFEWLLSWRSRVNERQADHDASARAGVDPVMLKQLHVSDRVLLEPTLLARLSSAHPSPAERLEFAARSRRRSVRPTEGSGP